jgi:hypothetical protein
MGTNYYFQPSCVGYRRLARMHIGKASFGWRFLFHVTETIKSADDWFKILGNGVGIISDEYGNMLTFDEFREYVNSKRFEDNSNGRGDFYGRKYYRDRKYDYMEGEFC